MLSILIPTYNYNVFPLASKLEKQALEANINFEILCIDDGSNSILNAENTRINNLTNSKFIALEKNIGLANNRNKLVETSKFKNLLFIDGDSMLIDGRFIHRYLMALDEKVNVIYGGRVHPKTIEPKRRLRWKYGVYREDKTVIQRNKAPYKCTLFNNTLIKRSVFNRVYFNKSIVQYGYEDVLFSYDLHKMKATVKHINNPVLHDDVDLNEVYFNKIQKGLKNLNFIYQENIIDLNYITFLKVFIKLKKYKLNYMFASFYKLFHPILKLNLTSNYPSLFLFELFRLSYFCHINLNK